MYTLHIGNKNYSSWSLRPWILMRDRSIAFHEKLHVFGPKFAAKAEAGSPTNKVPLLQDGDLVVWDSLAIAEYLAERHAAIWPADPVARAWARCMAAEMHSGFGALRNDCSMNCGIRVKLNAQSDALKKDVQRIGEAWSEGIARFGGPFLAGKEFTAVDAFFAPVVFRVQTYGLDLPAPAGGYVRHMLARPAMKEWYEAALKEPFRDQPHEIDIEKSGRITQDLRA